MENTVTLNLDRYHKLINYEEAVVHDLVLTRNISDYMLIEVYSKDDFAEKVKKDIDLEIDRIQQLEINIDKEKRAIKDKLNNYKINMEVYGAMIKEYNKLPWYKRAFKKVLDIDKFINDK